MPRAGRDHTGNPRRRHHHGVDRTHRPCALVHREPPDRDEFRPDAGRCARPGSLYGHPRLMSLLRTRGLCAFYGDFQVLFDIDLSVEEGETVAIIGPNGAGTTPLLRAV